MTTPTPPTSGPAPTPGPAPAPVHAVFTNIDRCWVWSPGTEYAHRAPWLDGYDLLGLAPTGDALLVKESPVRDRHLPQDQRTWGKGSRLMLADVTTEQVSLLLDWHPDHHIGWWGAWDRTATQVAFHAVEIDDDENAQVIVLDLAQGTTRRLYHGPGTYSINQKLAWSPDGTMLAVDLLIEDDQVETVLVLDTATGAVLAHAPSFILLGAPGGGWTQDGLLVVSMEYGPGRDAPCPLPTARTVRVPNQNESLPFKDDHNNAVPTLHLRSFTDQGRRAQRLRWLEPDGTPSTVLCTVPDPRITGWLTIPTI